MTAETFTLESDSIATMSLVTSGKTVIWSNIVDAVQWPWTVICSQLTLIYICRTYTRYTHC